MPENKFENKVQQEMLGFKIKPSKEVWLNVEERIRKKKKRRFLFMIFFLAGLSLLGYWQRDFLYSDSDVLTVESTTTSNDKMMDSKKIKTTAAAEHNKQFLADAAKESNQPNTSSTEKSIISTAKKIISSVNKKEETTVQGLIVTKKTPSVSNEASSNESTINHIATEKKLKEVTTKEKNFITKIADSISDVSTEKLVDEGIAKKNQINSIQKTEKEADLIAVTKIFSDSLMKNESTADTLAVLKKTTAKSAKWKWGLHITPGKSFLNEKIFSISSNKNIRDLRANTSSVGSPSSTPPASPSKRETGFSLQLGGFAQRKISPRMELSLGFQYSYYSDHILVGGRRDSVLNFSPQLMAISDASIVYGAANASANYTNRYHFIELPVTLHIRLNKNLNKPFNLNLGVVAGQMFASNALVYDRSFGGIYYKNKSQFNKTQFSLTSGFEWTIPIRKMQWNVGPTVDVHINRFMLNPNETDTYLLMFGLRTRIIFSSKK